MTKIYHLIFICFTVIYTSAQIPNQESLIGIHSINTLSDTSSINNPYEGSLVYVSDINVNYQYNGIKWDLWYKSIAGPTDIDSLTILVDEDVPISDTCCLFEPNTYHNCTNPPYPTTNHCIGDTLHCGVITHIAPNEIWIMAPDEYIDVQWTPSGTGNTYYGLGPANMQQVTNDCPDCYSAARICYEYEPEGCQNSNLDWTLPLFNMIYNIRPNFDLINSSLQIIDADNIYDLNLYWSSYDVPGGTEAIVFQLNLGNPNAVNINTAKILERRVRPFAVVSH